MWLFQEAIGQTDLIRQAVKCLSRDQFQEREEAVALLYDLSKSYPLCEKIGATNGAILILVGMTSSISENVRAAELADLTLTNLERCDNNVLQMAENGRLQPLLDRLIQGCNSCHSWCQSKFLLDTLTIVLFEMKDTQMCRSCPMLF